MIAQQINRISGIAVVGLSLTALLTVLSGYAQPSQFNQRDEGTAAHIFQLSIVAVVPMIAIFLATVDWKRPGRSVSLLMITAVALVLAFGALYYGEHYYR